MVKNENVKKVQGTENAKDVLSMLNALNITEKIKGSKESIFKKEFSNKKSRTQSRNMLERFAKNILVHAKYKKHEPFKKELNDFLEFYKERYLKNDFTLKSIYTGTEIEKINLIENMFLVIKEKEKIFSK
jgi:hypothetical protein